MLALKQARQTKSLDHGVRDTLAVLLEHGVVDSASLITEALQPFSPVVEAGLWQRTLSSSSLVFSHTVIIVYSRVDPRMNNMGQWSSTW